MSAAFQKNICGLALLACVFSWLAVPVCAAGFYGPGAMTTITTVADALRAKDDSPCVLEGHLQAKLPGRKNRYVFTDDTGRIVVEIRRKVFGERTVTPANRLRLTGEVDWSSKHPNEVDVEEFDILQ